MNRVQFKDILNRYYAKTTINSLLCGRRTPSYRQAVLLEQKENIPLNAWQNIKLYLQENATEQKTCAQEFPTVQECDDGNSSVQSGESVDVDSHNDGR
jgi:hypothetical protein